MTRTFTRRAVWGAACALVAVALWPPGPRQADAHARPRYGGAAAVAVSEPIVSMDPSRAAVPAERALCGLMFEPLFERFHGEVRPLLVQAWQANADSTQWTLVLKTGVRLHDGAPLSARDVAHSLRRIIDSPDSQPYRWPLRHLIRVEALADPDGGGHQKVVLTFDAPERRLPLMLSCPGLAVVGFPRSESVNSSPSYGPPLGTGPFALDGDGAPGGFGSEPARSDRPGVGERGTDEEPVTLKLPAFEGHHAGRPFLDAVFWRRFVPFEDAVIELQAGTLDAAAGIPYSEWKGTSSPSAGVRSRAVKSTHLLYLACNPWKTPLRDISIRRNLLAAIDRASMMRSLVGENGCVAHGLLPGQQAPSALWGARREEPSGGSGGAEARPTGERWGDAAETMGRPDSPTLTLLAPGWHSVAVEVADRIQVDLMAAGYTVTVRSLGRGEMGYKPAQEGQFDLLLGIWSPDLWLDEEEWLMSHFWETQIRPVRSLSWAVAHNESRFPAPDQGIFEYLEQMLAEESLLLPLFHLDTAILTREDLVVEPGPWGFPDLAWSWLKAGRD